MIHFKRNHGFYGDHFENGHNDQLFEESSFDSDLRDVSEPNGTAHGDFRAERSMLP